MFVIILAATEHPPYPPLLLFRLTSSTFLCDNDIGMFRGVAMPR